jgi:CheY-like chemotaxis protein
LDDQEGCSSKRVLLVEDEMMVAMMLEDMLEELGYTSIGPVTQLCEAIRIADEDVFDAAILDVNLNGQVTYSVAEVLLRRGIPFVFATGYGSSVLDERFRNIPTLQKPFQSGELARALEAVSA